MPIRALFFDLGGVLIQRVDRGRRGFWEKRLGISALEIAEQVWVSPIGRLALVGRATSEDVWAEFGRKFSLTSEELSCLETDFQDESTWESDLLDFIRTLRPTYKTGVISDAFINARARLSLVIPADSFDTMVFSAEEGLTKPDPSIFRRALERLNVSASEAIFVDDIPRIVEGARKLGMHAIQFHNSHQVIANIKTVLEIEEEQGLSHV
jgi:epoxide hydrolase-like predicted phosphatase